MSEKTQTAPETPASQPKFAVGQSVYNETYKTKQTIAAIRETANGFSYSMVEVAAQMPEISLLEMPAAQGMDLPPTVFNAIKPAKCLVRIMETDPNGVTVQIIRPFNTEQEFLFYWQNKANFGFNFPETATYEILTQAQIAEFLLPLQEKIIANEKAKIEAKKVYDESKQLSKQLSDLVGFGYMFQDAAGVVYKTNEPTWKAIHYDKAEIQRTRYEGETKGSLSMPEAREAGFIVEGEAAKSKKKTAE